MKQIFIFFLLFVSASKLQQAAAQSTSASFKVWGNCGMCKKTIESAALKSGASSASWNQQTKMLAVSYDKELTSADKIQKEIASSGYDNDGYEAPDEVYNKLHGCCQYDRKKAGAGSAEKACCIKEGKCKGDKSCCSKTKNKKDCCATASCGKEGGCCSDCKSKKRSCCSSSGKCEKDGKGQCKEHHEDH